MFSLYFTYHLKPLEVKITIFKLVFEMICLQHAVKIRLNAFIRYSGAGLTSSTQNFQSHRNNTSKIFGGIFFSKSSHKMFIGITSVFKICDVFQDKELNLLNFGF